tara:strand:+ start:3752 stop:5539 length:1788 start_codon:yes stop_codon:yes gene_type:complete
MCGFFIELRKKNFLSSRKFFHESSKLISHRGDTPKKSYEDKNFRADFYRLKIIDLSNKGDQPMFDISKRYIINFNGEIYNAKKLLKHIPNIKLKSKCDTEILINLFSKYGPKTLDLLEGMFSFVIYDTIEKKCFLARDRFGIKPLYYSDTQNSLIISSEIKPILKYKSQKKFNYNAFGDFFLLGHLDHGENTFFDGINSLEPGNFISISGQNKKKVTYWNIINNFNEDSNEDTMNNLLAESLNQHLISDKKIGLFLSGGIDSNALAAYYSKKLNYHMDTYTYDFINNKYGESFKAKNVAKQLGLKNLNYKLKPKDIIKQIDDLTETLESPFTSMRLFGVNALYKKAKENNLKVVIEGHGGDEMFGGYGYNFFPYLSDKFSNKELEKKFGKKTLQKKMLAKKNQGQYTTDGTYSLDYEIMNKDFLNLYLKKNEAYSYKHKRNLNNLKKSQLNDIRYIKLPRMLKYTDRISMKHGIEARVPFLNHKLFSFCFNLPNNKKYNEEYGSKYLLKKVINNLNLNTKVEKQKQDIVDPQTLWMTKYFKSFFMDNVNSTNLVFNEIFNKEMVIKRFNNIEKNKKSSFSLFSILTTMIFLKKFE